MNDGEILEFPAGPIRSRRRFIEGYMKEIRRLVPDTREIAWYEEQITDIYDTQFKVIIDGDLMGGIRSLASEIVRLRAMLRDAGIDYSR